MLGEVVFVSEKSEGVFSLACDVTNQPKGIYSIKIELENDKHSVVNFVLH